MSEQIQLTVAKLEERLEQHDKRITRNEDMTSHMHKLTASVEALYNEVRGQNARMEKILTNIESSLTRQGERIGELEKKGSKKLETIFATVVTVIITAVVMYFIGNIGA